MARMHAEWQRAKKRCRTLAKQVELLRQQQAQRSSGSDPLGDQVQTGLTRASQENMMLGCTGLSNILTHLQVRAQLTALMADKAGLVLENAQLQRENANLQARPIDLLPGN